MPPFCLCKDVFKQQYTSCMKVASDGNWGLSREYPNRLFGPIFYSAWQTCSPSGGLCDSSSSATTAAIRSALEDSEGRRQALTQCLKEAQHTIQAQSQRLSCAEGNNILNFTEISGYRFSEQVCTVLYCIFIDQIART